MAFTTAGGYGNLPNGNFSPVIYSKKVQLAFRKATVVGDITNSDYFGEIAAQGDTVKIIKEPEISVSAYARGQTVTAQDLDDEDMTEVTDIDTGKTALKAARDPMLETEKELTRLLHLARG